MDKICDYDEAFTRREMYEETGRCLDCLATWAKNHMGWARAKKSNKRTAKRRMRQAWKKEATHD